MGNSAIDPMGICVHSKVERAHCEDSPFYSKYWECSFCHEQFSGLLPREEASAKIQWMPKPPELPTLRDRFAMSALTGLLANGPRRDLTDDGIASIVGAMADAMLAERQRFTGKEPGR